MLTQHAEAPWDIEHPMALNPDPGTPRSTSVGDVITVDDRVAYQCDHDGWRSVNLSIVRALTDVDVPARPTFSIFPMHTARGQGDPR
jgi:hypothetical protein